VSVRVKETAAPAATRGEGGELLTPAELAAWRGLLRVHASVVARLDDELRRAHAMSLTTYEALMLLGEAPGRRLRVSELSSATLLSVSGMSRMVDRLEREGLVERRACETDGRGAEVVLTDEGRERLRAARATHLAGVRNAFLSRIDDDDLRALARAWERVGG
jgi:DNA-binding MarR family transcriptional regulator